MRAPNYDRIAGALLDKTDETRSSDLRSPATTQDLGMSSWLALQIHSS